MTQQQATLQSTTESLAPPPPPPIQPPTSEIPPPPSQPPPTTAADEFDSRTDCFNVAFEHRSNSPSKAIIATWHSWTQFNFKLLHKVSKDEASRQMFVHGLKTAKKSSARTLKIRASDPFIFLLQQQLETSTNLIHNDPGIFELVNFIRNRGQTLILEYVSEEMNCHCQELARATFDEREPLQLDPLQPIQALAVTFSPKQIYAAASSSKHHIWRSLPSHCIATWVQLVANLPQPEFTTSQNESLLVCAPVIFLTRAASPTVEALATQLANLAASKSARHKRILEFLMTPKSMNSHPPGDVVKKVEKLVALGAERKASQLLEREQNDNLSTDGPTLQDITSAQQLFPDLKEPLSTNESIPLAPISSRKFITALRRLSRASAPGHDGWTKELLTPLFNGRNGQTSGMKQATKDRFVGILNAIVNNFASSELSTFLRQGILILIAKPNGKKRPIILSSLLSKLAWKTMLLEINVKSSLHPSMVHGRLPCQKGIHRAQLHLEKGGTVLQLDAANGFGEIKRSVILEALQQSEDLACLRPLFNLMYTDAFIATQFGKDGLPIGQVTVTEGVLQGCAAAPYLFSLGLSHGIKQIADDHKLDMHVVADDIAIFIPDQKLPTLPFIVDQCAAALSNCGITLNPSKSVLICQLSKQHLIPPCAITNIVERADYLGGIISTSETQIPFTELRPKYIAKMSAFTHHLDQNRKASCQVLNLILRYILSCWGYFFSTTKPSITKVIAEEVDLWSRQSFSKIHGRQVSDNEWYQLSLLDSDGGNSLTSWKDLSPEIYNATRAVSLSIEAEANQNIFQLTNRISAKRADLFYDSLELLQHSSSQSPSQQSPPRSRLSQKARSNLIRRAHSESNFHWVAVRPEEKITAINDSQWRINMDLRLLHDSTTLPACSTYVASSSKNDHLLCCNTCSGGLWKVRHQRILHAMALVLREASVLMTTSDVVRRFGINRDDGPDGLILMDKSIAIDVTVTHQTENAHYYRPHQRFQEKIAKYKHLAAMLNWDLAPLVFTSLGHPTKPTQKWLKTFSSTSCIAGTNRRLQAAMTIATIRGNADIVRLTDAANTLYPTEE